MQKQREVFCTGIGCKIANKCRRFTQNTGRGDTINPPTRVNCLTKMPQPINGCELFVSDGDNFFKVIENDIGDV